MKPRDFKVRFKVLNQHEHEYAKEIDTPADDFQDAKYSVMNDLVNEFILRGYGVCHVKNAILVFYENEFKLFFHDFSVIYAD